MNAYQIKKRYKLVYIISFIQIATGTIFKNYGNLI